MVLLLFQPALAQNTPVKDLQGRVLANGEDVTGVVVRNATSKKATITDARGHFSIPVKLNDTLVFLAVQFKSKKLPVTRLIYNTSFVNVPLEPFVNELQEVVVQPFDLTGDLSKDADKLELPQDVSAEALGLPNARQKIPTQSERKLQEASKMAFTGSAGGFGAGGALSLNPLINAITGRTKMLKKRVAIDRKYAQTERVQQSIVDSLFIDTLKIPKDRIADFMYFCEADPGFSGVVNSGDQLRIWQFMIDKSEVYRKNNGLD
ncbi:MAG: hypothetical protein CMH48_14970 [Muricauda sp.]|nr:hypothetical protein [Allomuricauda sp.]|tara:strand:+ start:51766 stop:52554 length:789 start_codon:yes stop_codon:yes gene_type:complete